jgi:DNA-binding MarR family transcriptional regulator
MTRRAALDLGDYLPYLINRVGSALVVDFSEAALARHRLSIGMWRVLAVLASAGRQRQIDLAELTSIEASTLSRVVTRLVRMALVTRTRSKTSSREVVVQLTAKGEALVERLTPTAIAYEEIAAAGLATEELALVRRALRQMHRNLREARERERRPAAAKPAARTAAGGTG